MSATVRFAVNTLARPADDVDLSAVTTAKRVGPARWVADQPGVVEIPFDRDLTAAEQSAVLARLTSTSDTEATLRANLQAFLTIASPTAAQTAARLKDLIRLVVNE